MTLSKTHDKKSRKYHRNYLSRDIQGLRVGADFARRMGYKMYDKSARHVMFVHVTSMDCDGTRSEYIKVLPARLRELVNLRESMYANAEGPWSAWVVGANVAQDFAPSQRDLALEAYEDGHPHVLYL